MTGRARVATLALSLLIVACSPVAPAVTTPSPTAEPGVFAVTVLLDLSGPRSGIGSAQRDAIQRWIDQRGSARPTIRTDVIDLGGSQAKLFIELRRAADETRADAVVIGVPVTYDDVLGRAIEISRVPVIFTLPLDVDPAGRTGGRWAFALAPALEDIAALSFGDASARGVIVPSLVLADARERADPLASALAKELTRRGLDPITRIALPADGSVPPVVRSSLSVLRSVHCTGLASTCVPVAREARALFAPTLFYLSHLTTTADLGDRDLASRAVFPGSRHVVERATGSHAAIAADAMSLLGAAAERAGTEDRLRSRDALEAITMPLIASTYSFSAQRHQGFAREDLALLRWTGSAIALALPAAAGSGVPTPTPRPLTPSPAASP